MKKTLKYFLFTILSLILIVALLVFIAFKFELISISTDFEPNEIKKLNITNAELESMNLLTLDAHQLKRIISNYNNEQKPLIFSLWASHCKPCIREFELLDSLNLFENEEINFVILNADPIDAKRNRTVKRILYGKNLKFTTYQVLSEKKFKLFISEEILNNYLSQVFEDYEIGFPLTKVWDDGSNLVYNKVGLNEYDLIEVLNKL